MKYLAFAAVAAVFALALTAAGTLSSRLSLPRATLRRAGGPYRSAAGEQDLVAATASLGLVAWGSALLSMTLVPLLVAAISTLRWEGIGISLLPALALMIVRFFVVVRREAEALHTVAKACLLLDVPLALFAFVHLSADEAHGAHDPFSLAAVAAAYALVDAAQSALVVACREAT